jgi:hypothetical protein
MAELPFDLFEKIADVADIDTRRHMGFPPRKLCKQRLAVVEDTIRQRLAMQYMYLETIGMTSVYVCSTVLPISKNKLLYISYSMLFNKIYFIMMIIEDVVNITLGIDDITWHGTPENNAIYVEHPYSPHQDVSIASCHGISCKITQATLNSIRQFI